MCGQFVSKTEAAIEREFNATPRQWRMDFASYRCADAEGAGGAPG
ncbi:hypothetical protein QWY84_18990 [Aquisalimonas lutea]|nr:hypothetical protein [Aquisalimonas lutea]MDN3519700.1 hypothetical protein [Aquisalimonas lutea]